MDAQRGIASGRARELPGSDITPEIFARAFDLVTNRVSVPGGCAQRRRQGGDAEHASAIHHHFAGRLPRGARMENGNAAGKRGWKCDHVAFRISVGVSLRRDDDADCMFGFHRQLHPGQISHRRRPEQGEHVGLQPGQHHLRLRIAKPRIIFDHSWSPGREHDANKKRAAIIHALRRNGVHRRPDDLVLNAIEQRRRHNPGRGVRAHPTGIRTRITIAGTLAGVAGALFAFSKGSISPEVLSVPRSVDALVMVLLGGVQTLTGAVWGAGLFTWLEDSVSREIEYWRAAIGAVIVLLVLAFPQGVAGFVKERLAR